MSTHELRSALEAVFKRPLKDVRRILSPYSSSFTIEELGVTFANGETLTTVLKNLSPSAMLEDARQAKPDFLYSPDREIEVYRCLLSPAHLGTARMYGAAVHAELGRYWLFLEKVRGSQLDEIGEFETWLTAARWLAKLHSSCDWISAQRLVPQLLKYDASYYRRWIQRAHASIGSTLDPIAAGYDRVIDILLDLPPAILHGEFYASNILVQEQATDIRMCPVDWEMAAVGPGLLDVAALASGKWNRIERLNILDAYCSILPQRLKPRNYLIAFDCCQLQTAVQWLGWSQSWSPPQAHAHDWLAEALQIASQESIAALFG